MWGLAVHPSKLQFVTASDDQILQVWDIPTKSVIASTKLSTAARSVAISPDGSMYAVGLSNGTILVLDSSSLKEVFKKRHRKEVLHELKFSPSGKYLAVGSNDNFVDIYDTSSWARTGYCRGNSSFITHLDWSKDEKCIVTNSGAYEHLMCKSTSFGFINFEDAAPSGKQITERVLARKVNDASFWATFTGVLGDNIQGIWPRYSDKTDVNSLDMTKDGTAIATGDDFGFVKIFSYPCKKGAEFKKSVGHSAHVTNVRFTYNDSHLISVGGGDRAVFQWAVKR